MATIEKIQPRSVIAVVFCLFSSSASLPLLLANHSFQGLVFIFAMAQNLSRDLQGIGALLSTDTAGSQEEQPDLLQDFVGILKHQPGDGTAGSASTEKLPLDGWVINQNLGLIEPYTTASSAMETRLHYCDLCNKAFGRKADWKYAS